MPETAKQLGARIAALFEKKVLTASEALIASTLVDIHNELRRIGDLLQKREAI